MVINRKYILAFLLVTLILTGCSQKRDYRREGPKEAFRYLERLYNDGKYAAASEGFDYFTLNYSGSTLVDSAQYLLGRCHYEMKEYLIAASSFEELTRRFPTSRLVSEAMFEVGVCYWRLSPKYHHDQEYTLLAIDAFQSFIEYYPERTQKVQEAQIYIDKCRYKLARKDYRNGIIYLKMKDWTSALIYFQSVLDLYYDTEFAPKASFQKAVVQKRAELHEDAINAFHAYMDKYPDHEWTSKALNAIQEIREELMNEENTDQDEG